ncbi:HB2D protein, partial [Agelaius phoeniceus]|nr:HB2D protein [Agelaius phoeniceus]
GGTTELCPALTGVFQHMFKAECHFINGTEKVRFVDRYIYNREPFVMFDSDVGHFVGFTPLGERWAKGWNSDPAIMEDERTAVDRHCRHNYGLAAPYLPVRRAPPSPSQSIPVHSQS